MLRWRARLTFCRHVLPPPRPCLTPNHCHPSHSSHPSLSLSSTDFAPPFPLENTFKGLPESKVSTGSAYSAWNARLFDHQSARFVRLVEMLGYHCPKIDCFFCFWNNNFNLPINADTCTIPMNRSNCTCSKAVSAAALKITSDDFEVLHARDVEKMLQGFTRNAPSTPDMPGGAAVPSKSTVDFTMGLILPILLFLLRWLFPWCCGYGTVTYNTIRYGNARYCKVFLLWVGNY